MDRSPSRRALLATLSLSVVAGCLSRTETANGEDDATSDESDRSTDEECDLESGRWQGEGEPITTRVELDQDDTEQFERDGWRIERECATVAAKAAFGELNDHLAVDIEGKNWAGYGSSYGDDGASAWVQFAYTRDRDGNVFNCPDPAFSVATARSSLPAEVVVTLDVAEWDEPFDCTHEIQLRTGSEELD